MIRRTKKNRTIKNSFKDSMNGLSCTLLNESNFKREVFFGIIALILSFILEIDKRDFITILIVIFLVLVLELINTAIETTVDLFTQEYHPLAKMAKDVSASAVLIMCFLALIVGFLIFGPKIMILIKGGI